MPDCPIFKGINQSVLVGFFVPNPVMNISEPYLLYVVPIIDPTFADLMPVSIPYALRHGAMAVPPYCQSVYMVKTFFEGAGIRGYVFLIILNLESPDYIRVQVT